MPRKRTPRTTGRFCVADRTFPTLGAAISHAQGLACRWALEHHAEERSFYVRDALDVGLYRVDILEDVVYTTEVKAVA